MKTVGVSAHGGSLVFFARCGSCSENIGHFPTLAEACLAYDLFIWVGAGGVLKQRVNDAARYQKFTEADVDTHSHGPWIRHWWEVERKIKG